MTIIIHYKYLLIKVIGSVTKSQVAFISQYKMHVFTISVQFPKA